MQYGHKTLLGAMAALVLTMFLPLAPAAERASPDLPNAGAERMTAARSVSHYTAAARHGRPEALFALGIVYEYGHGVAPDPYRAAQYYYQAGVLYAARGARVPFANCRLALRRLNPEHPFLKLLTERPAGQHRAT